MDFKGRIYLELLSGIFVVENDGLSFSKVQFALKVVKQGAIVAETPAGRVVCAAGVEVGVYA
ncbi:MAG: hypothetical protein ACK4FB_14695 [Brevundimonas sp.]